MRNGNPEECERAREALERVFVVLGKRWNGLILGMLLVGGQMHFAELRRTIPGISERILSDRLSELADGGLVLRTVEEGPPLGVTYQLTERGKALEPALIELGTWADRFLDDPPGARRRSTS
jgi:DNA-binding HxlR family transcriptional regulator